jgi:hypothetical protein
MGDATVKLPTGFKWNPAYYLMVLNALVALAVAYFPGLNLTDTTTAAITTGATALAGVGTVLLVRPVDIAAAVAGLGVAVQAGAAFGLHLTANQAATGAAALSVVLGLVFHQTVTPQAAIARGATVEDLNRRAAAARVA